MNRKALLWAICALLYAMQLPFAVAIIIVAVNPDFSAEIVRGIAIASASLCVLIVALCILNITTAVKDYLKGQKYCPYATTAKVKLALIPFFIINFVIWAFFWLGTLNMFLIWAAPAVWIISLFTTYVFMLGGGVQNISYLIRRFRDEGNIKYLVFAVLHFIYIADVIAAVLAYLDGRTSLNKAKQPQ